MSDWSLMIPPGKVHNKGNYRATSKVKKLIQVDVIDKQVVILPDARDDRWSWAAEHPRRTKFANKPKYKNKQTFTYLRYNTRQIIVLIYTDGASTCSK